MTRIGLSQLFPLGNSQKHSLQINKCRACLGISCRRNSKRKYLRAQGDIHFLLAQILKITTKKLLPKTADFEELSVAQMKVDDYERRQFQNDSEI